VGDGVLFLAGVFDVRLENPGVEQVDDAQAAARHLVFISRSNAPAGGPDLLPAGRAFRSQLDHAVVGQDDLGPVRDKELAVHIDTEVAQFGDFLEESDRVQHDAVADDAFAVGAQHAAGDKLQHEFLALDDDGVSGIMTAGVTGDGGKLPAEHIHNLAFAFVAPLGAEHHCCLRSHEFHFPGSTGSGGGNRCRGEAIQAG
jgi:hypothetical protein